MRIQHDTLILVADGGKMLLFRNDGDADYPRFERIAGAESENPPDRAQKNDAPGRAFSGGRRSAYEETDFHRQAEAQFARAAAAMLDRVVDQRQAERVVVAADPRTLGALRDHYSARVAGLVTAEVAKDLVKHPVAEIERILCGEAVPR